MAKRILIIGGTGNMGYYLSQRLSQTGLRPYPAQSRHHKRRFAALDSPVKR